MAPGDFPPNPPGKPGYRLEFQDEFEGDSLDRSRWLPYHLPHWSSRERAAARCSLSGGCLRLHITADQAPWCPQYDGATRVSSVQTGCFSGPPGSAIGQHHFRPGLAVAEAQPLTRLYTPHSGYFETRLKAVPVPGYMVAFWMIGFEERPEQSAEICIAEIFGRDMAAGSVVVGYGLHPFGDPAIRDEFYRDAFPIDAAAFHVYAAEWAPEGVTFFVDNVRTRSIAQSPGYPLQLMLGIYALPGQLTPESDRAPWPKTLEVDYVRGYRALEPGPFNARGAGWRPGPG